jgi:hypothetical protein
MAGMSLETLILLPLSVALLGAGLGRGVEKLWTGGANPVENLTAKKNFRGVHGTIAPLGPVHTVFVPGFA